ncbi:PP2C family protein-serine/threonine phosphatase [Haliangium sp.]|uniref:PP2C family protein-serine/threonine phosphatase n=1 Tax=Haliangium sp. TaxID=2663208 RepID=UPI003D13E4CB
MFALAPSGECLAQYVAAAENPADLTDIAHASERLRELAVAAGSGLESWQTLLVRYERCYLLLRPVALGTVLLLARANANLSMINVGFRVLELKLAKGADDAQRSTGLAVHRPPLEIVFSDPVITDLQTLFHDHLGPAARVLFKNRVRLLAGELMPPIADEPYSRLVEDLGRFIRDAGRRELFALRAERGRLSRLARRLAGERDELRSLLDTVEEGIRICHRIATPTSGTDLASDDEVANDIIDFCATNDSLLAKHGASFREGFLRLTDQILATRRELDEAGRLQRMLVPNSSELEHSFANLAAYFAPAAQCGGDWWTSKRLPDDRLLVMVGDVTGHSLSTAIITGVAKAAFDVAHTTSEPIAAEHLLARMNAAIYDATRAKVLMTCVASILDPRTRTITVASAGHNFPYLVRNHHGQSSLHTLVSRGNPLGAKPTLEVESTTQPLYSGDLMVWYTDGATECENDQAEPFGDRRFRRMIGDLGGLDAPAVRDTIAHRIDSFRGNAVLSDDMTFIAGKVIDWNDLSRRH